jgi:hypothetical protein
MKRRDKTPETGANDEIEVLGEDLPEGVQEPVKPTPEMVEKIQAALGDTQNGPLASSDPGVMNMNVFVEVMDKLLSGLHLRQKTNLKPAERNGLATLDAQLVHKFERRGYVDTVLLKYCDSFREHSVSIDDVGGKRVTSALNGVGGSPSSTINQYLPPQITGK